MPRVRVIGPIPPLLPKAVPENLQAFGSTQKRLASDAITPAERQRIAQPGPGAYEERRTDVTGPSKGAVSGRIPFQLNFKESTDRWLDGSFDLKIGGALPLALWSFVDPDMQSFEGDIEMDGVIEGPAQRPVPRSR